MAAKKALNAKSLEALGAERLAELLIEVSDANPAVKRRLRLEVAGTQSPGAVAKEVRKRLAAIARSRSFIDWQNIRTFADDLDMQRRAISGQLAKADPAEALDLTWQFLALASSIHERCDDSSGIVGDVFRAAVRDLGEIAVAAKPSPESLADRAFDALNANDYSQYDELIRALSPALGPRGLDHLKRRFMELSKRPPENPNAKDRKPIGWGSGGPIYAHEIANRRRETTVRVALQEIADALGDVDGFIAQYSDEARTAPRVAAEIARRLLDASRAQEAWDAINAAATDRPGRIPFEWEETRLNVMEALGRAAEAQEFRWSCFERSLDEAHLRAHLKRLPDFDDVEAERRALSHAQKYPDVHQALAFLVFWPALEQATALVLDRVGELDGNIYEILSPAADALARKYPLAATLLFRAMIDFSLKHNRVKRYRHAARHLAECASLASAIADFGNAEPHDQYVGRLKAEHGRKSSFWTLLS